MSVITRWPQKELCFTARQRASAVSAVEEAFASTLESLRVDIGLVEMLEAIYVPLGAWVACRKKHKNGPLILGINGAQGAGKSTLFNLLEVILTEGFGLKVVGFSIDDLYKTRQQRQQLGDCIHPLLKTRGVPGTHDVELGIEILYALKNSGPDSVTKIPVFDKSTDERCEEAVWQEWTGPVDVIVLEGWCVGAHPQEETQLIEPINELEQEMDPDGSWRQYVNAQLSDRYQLLFSMLDMLIMLKVPSMEAVYEWRSLQEKKLAERVRYIYNTQQPTQHLKIMDEGEIRRFIQHYERLTQQMLEDMPERADIVLCLNNNHKIYDIRINQPGDCCR